MSRTFRPLFLGDSVEECANAIPESMLAKYAEQLVSSGRSALDVYKTASFSVVGSHTGYTTPVDELWHIHWIWLALIAMKTAERAHKIKGSKTTPAGAFRLFTEFRVAAVGDLPVGMSYLMPPKPWFLGDAALIENHKRSLTEKTFWGAAVPVPDRITPFDQLFSGMVRLKDGTDVSIRCREGGRYLLSDRYTTDGAIPASDVSYIFWQEK